MRTRIVLSLSFVFILFTCSKKESETQLEKSESYLLEELSHETTGIHFKNVVQDDLKHNNLNYMYFYNGGGISVGDINNDGLPDIYFVSNKGSNQLYLNKGNFSVEDITSTAEVQGKSDWQTGSTMVDINSDGYLDIYVCAVSGMLDFKGHNELYINNGDNTFTEKSEEYGLDYTGYSTQAYFFDYDKDDDLDVYIINHGVHSNTSHGPSLLRKKRIDLVGDVLLKNTNNKFTNFSEQAKIYGGANGYGLSASIADFNNDGWDDIYVCNDFHEDDYYYINNQDGTFTESLANYFSMISRFSMGSDAADINNDGLQDLITLDMLPRDEKIIKESEGDDVLLTYQLSISRLGYQDQYARNMLQINNQDHYFHEEAFFNDVAATDWSWAPLIADFNNDGHQDLFVANGIIKRPNDLDFMMYLNTLNYVDPHKTKDERLFDATSKMPTGKVPNEIFAGNSKRFENKSGKWINNNPSFSNGAVYVDLDQDGNLDLVTNNMNSYASVFKNTLDKGNNYVSISFEYKKGNTNGIGTKAVLHQGERKQLRQLFNSRGFMSSVDNSLHFGVSSSAKIDSIQVIWPNNKAQTIKEPTLNKHSIIRYSESKTHPWSSKKTNTKKQFKKVNYINYTHKEDRYNDFFYERLIPYKVSTSGPALAIADVDNNGYKDIFIGNSSGNKAVFFSNNGNSLKKKYISVSKDSLYEDTSAAFFDADSDGDLDLYVGSGLHEKRDKNYELDRLYLNVNGNFTRATDLPKNGNVTSTVRPYDYDDDGDVDLFIGNRSNPDNFGDIVESYILKNDGKGNFSIDKEFKLRSIVTDAVWEDINGDHQKDLLVSTEWDEPKIYYNQKGQLKLANRVDTMHGLWQTIYPYDIDKDGDLDIVLGNWGTNTRFSVSKEKPLLMYYSDFDSNGKSETVLAYDFRGNYYPIYSRDELASQMNIIKKRFVKNTDYALKTIEEVLTPEALKKATKFHIDNLKSGYLKNDNGKFSEFIELPKDFQLAPLNSFKKITLNNRENLLVFGNNKSVNTYHGGYESIKGLLLHNEMDIKKTSSLGIEPIDTQVEHVEIVSLKNKKIVLIVSNNDVLKSYLINE